MDLIAVGTIRTAWGLKGWLKLQSFSGEWTHFSDFETVILKSRNLKREREYKVEGFRMQQGGGLIKLSGIDTPELGKTLAGSEVLVPRDSGAPLNDNEWYIRDLIGLSLIDENESVLGEITGLIESADDLLEIKKTDGKNIIIPFRSCFVGEPDIEKGILVLTALWLMDES
ncbi:MAG: 16S rRNA processing protein RimM [Spirochaetaceae bacterium]|nr:16S rRNA processing protein RimM [Spirochaetaceae bacterium]